MNRPFLVAALLRSVSLRMLHSLVLIFSYFVPGALYKITENVSIFHASLRLKVEKPERKKQWICYSAETTIFAQHCSITELFLS